jgi:hypothetical protein
MEGTRVAAIAQHFSLVVTSPIKVKLSMVNPNLWHIISIPTEINMKQFLKCWICNSKHLYRKL